MILFRPTMLRETVIPSVQMVQMAYMVRTETLQMVLDSLISSDGVDDGRLVRVSFAVGNGASFGQHISCRRCGEDKQ